MDHCNRPFSSIQEHDEALIQNWNSVVKPGDKIYHLGDFYLLRGNKHVIKPKIQAILDRLNGQKFLIRGNHDEVVADGWAWVDSAHYIHVGKQKIYIHHYGCRVWRKSNYDAWHLYGHSHGNLPPLGKSCDVGVDCWGYTPVNYDTLKVFMDEQEPVNHHNPVVWDGLQAVQEIRRRNGLVE